MKTISAGDRSEIGNRDNLSRCSHSSMILSHLPSRPYTLFYSVHYIIHVYAYLLRAIAIFSDPGTSNLQSIACNCCIRTLEVKSVLPYICLLIKLYWCPTKLNLLSAYCTNRSRHCHIRKKKTFFLFVLNQKKIIRPSRSNFFSKIVNDWS